MEEKKYLETIKLMISMIKSGIKVNDEYTRPFDILDYDQITDIPFLDLYKYSKSSLSAEDARILGTYFGQYKSFYMLSNQLKPLSEQEFKNILELNDEVFCKRDEKGMPIPGTGRTITRDEKLALKDFIISNGSVLNKATFGDARKRFLNSLLMDEQNIAKL